MPSFTQRTSNLQQLGTIIEITLTPSLPFLQSTGTLAVSRSIKILAMIDTGASGTVISQGLARKLGLNPVGTILMNTSSSTDVNCYQYDLQIVFANDVNMESIIVTEAPLKGQHIQGLIGRDVLQHGVFIYTGHDNSFTMSF